MTPKNKVLIQFAHPALQKSRVNKAMAKAVRELPGVTFRDLYEEYPDLVIDVKKEQQLLREHDLILFQHPFYWYSAPAILKEWCDLVLEWGFAYGDGGEALNGKAWMHALTTGGPEQAYHKTGYNRFTVRQLLNPWDQTAHLCGMHFLAPYIEFGVHSVASSTQLRTLSDRYAKAVEALRDTSAPWTHFTEGEQIQEKLVAYAQR